MDVAEGDILREDVAAAKEVNRQGTLLEHHLGRSQNTGPGRVNATHAVSRGTTRLNVGPKTIMVARRRVLRLHSTGRESKCFT
jgi:hypothetical protein